MSLESGDNSNPVIIQKSKKHDHGHHGGAWKVAYADFVTAMMALFIVLWVLSQGEEVQKAVSGYFKDPVGFSSGAGKSIIEGLPNKSDMDDQLKHEIENQQLERKRLEQMGEEILSDLATNPDFADIMDQVSIEFVEEGMRIEMVESANEVFFEIGTAQINSRAKQILEKIAAELAKIPNKIIVEGHTDARPFPGQGQGYTNFELSTDRANSARRTLLAGGLKNGQIDEIRGYADSKLRNPGDPFDVVNRRISIIIRYVN